MKIAHRLTLNAVLFSGMVFAISLLFFAAFQMQRGAFAEAAFADSLMRGSYELNSLSNRFQRYPEDRPLAQWKMVYNELARRIEEKEMRPASHPEIMSRIRENLTQMKTLFDTLRAEKAAGEGDGRAPESEDRRALISDIIAKKSREISLDSSRLVQVNNGAISRINRRILFFIPGIGFIFAGLTLWSSSRISRSISLPVSRLYAGVEALSAGNLEHRIGAVADDELGRLAVAFDRMTDNLKNLTVSRDELRREVAERTRAEKSLRESEERFRAIYQQAAVGIELIDLNGKIIEGNGNLSELLGYTEADLRNHTFMELTHPEDLEKEHILLDQLLAGTIPSYTIEKRYIHKSGAFIWVRVTSSLARATVPYRISIIEDITERKIAQDRLVTLLSDLERSNRELEQFAYVASHDLQEPLRMVSSYVQLLERKYQGRLDQQADKYIHFAVDGARRMQKLIEGLLAYSRISRGKSEFSIVDMNRVFDAALSNLTASVHESGAKVLREDLPPVRGDETQLLQLFQNLIANAIKFRRPNSPPVVKVAAGTAGSLLRFSVSDNGIGILPEYHEKVFLIFQRLHTRAEYPGTGIGLALCKRIVERHHGRIWIETVPDGGTAFVFTLPKGGSS